MEAAVSVEATFGAVGWPVFLRGEAGSEGREARGERREARGGRLAAESRSEQGPKIDHRLLPYLFLGYGLVIAAHCHALHFVTYTAIDEPAELIDGVFGSA